MKHLLNPRWLLVINTLPITILFCLMISNYRIINTLLLNHEVTYWYGFGFVLLGLALMNLIYTGTLIFKKQKVSPFYGLVALITYIPYLYIYGYHFDYLMPGRIPTWMFSTDAFLYVGTFLMPTLAYALFILVHHFTPEEEDHKAGLNFFIALAIPISWYFFVVTILPLWKPMGYQLGGHAFTIFIIAGTVLFLFFLIRMIYILSLKRAASLKKYQLYWKIPITIIFPLLGLALNNGHLQLDLILGKSIFGNFSHFTFYGLAALNGIALCMPNLNNESYRLGLFMIRAACFSYTLYFFLVFLPFFPLSVVAIILVGLGFLMLSPLALFVIHIRELSADYKYLRTHLSQAFLRLIAIAAFLIIPLAITFTYLNHRRHLHRALDFVYQPDFQQSDAHINRRALASTLQTINMHKDDSRNIGLGFRTPYLSSYYNWLVLDNLMLSNSKIQKLENVFFGASAMAIAPEFINNNQVKITDVRTRSEWDEQAQVWRSWIDLEISNQQEDSWQAEYATTIELPNACWISDYYLYVGDRKEMGMMTEKKSALWVFSQIKNENRDPGLLYYLSGNKVAFRVFPFRPNEVRKTGIEFIHSAPVDIQLDGQVVQLGTPREEVMPSPSLAEGIIYLTAAQTQQLDTLIRRPYYHFLLDVSDIDEAQFRAYSTQIESLMQQGKLDLQKAKVSLVATASQTFDLTDSWTTAWVTGLQPTGFNLDRAIRKELVQHYQSFKSDYPVFIVLSPFPDRAIIEKDFSDLAFTFPEGDDFYVLMPDNQLSRYSLSAPSLWLPEPVDIGSISPKPVLAYPNRHSPTLFFPVAAGPAWGITATYQAGFDPSIEEKSWAAALTLAANWRWQQLHPASAEQIWRPSVKASFQAHILSPVTAMIVVENEAQKAALLQKQQQVLKGKASLDAGEDAAKMSEPNFYLVLLLGGLLLWWHRRRNRSVANA